MELANTPGCCSSHVLYHIGAPPKELIRHVFNNAERRRPIILFTDRVSYGNGVRLAAFIRQNKLGSVIGCAPKTGNHLKPVKGWAWGVDWEAMNAYAKQNKWMRRQEPRW